MGLVGRERERERRVRTAGREPHAVHHRESADGGRRGRRAVPDRERAERRGGRATPAGGPPPGRPPPASATSAAAASAGRDARPGCVPRRARARCRAHPGVRAPAPTAARRTASLRPPSRRACAAARAASPSDTSRGRSAGRARATRAACDSAQAAARHPGARARGAPPPMPRHRRCTHRRPRGPRPRPETPSRKAYARGQPPDALRYRPPHPTTRPESTRLAGLSGAPPGEPVSPRIASHALRCASVAGPRTQDRGSRGASPDAGR